MAVRLAVVPKVAQRLRIAVGRGLLAFLCFLSRPLLLLAPGGPDVLLDAGQGQPGGFHAGGQVEDVGGVVVAVAEHLAHQARLLLLGNLRWALQIFVALEGVYIRPHGLAVQAAEALLDRGGFGVKAVTCDLAGAAHGANRATTDSVGSVLFRKQGRPGVTRDGEMW